jgi:hypothetical protein
MRGGEEDDAPSERVDSAAPDSPPARGAAGDAPSSPGGSAAKEGKRRRLEGVIPEIVRRAVELGVEKAQEAPDNLKQFVGDMKLPKEIAHVLFNQIDETKNGLFRVVAKEMRDFLEHTNIAGELQKMLTTVQFEVNTTIRFTPNDGRKSRRERDDDDRDADGQLDDGSAEATPSDKDASDAGERRPTPLPRPEVKTQVHVRRDETERERRRRRDRGA